MGTLYSVADLDRYLRAAVSEVIGRDYPAAVEAARDATIILEDVVGLPESYAGVPAELLAVVEAISTLSADCLAEQGQITISPERRELAAERLGRADFARIGKVVGEETGAHLETLARERLHQYHKAEFVLSD